MKRSARSGGITSSVVRYASVLAAGPLIWSLHLGLVYAVHHVSCRASVDPGAFVTPVAIGATAMAMLALAAVAAWPARLMQSRCASVEPSLRRFLEAVTRWLVLLSAFGVLWTWIAFLLVRSCGS